MIRRIPLLSPAQVAELTAIAAAAKFVDGKISNPHSKVKNNLQLHDPQPYEKSSRLLMQALVGCPEFMEFAFPRRIASPLITRYGPGMHYGLHPDAAHIPLRDGPLRSDLSCTIFLADPATYVGGALRITLGDSDIRFREAAGTAIVYPSSTLHEVEAVESGERMVAITFIESEIADVSKRNLLFELNEVAALEGQRMDPANYTRLQAIQFNLARRWKSQG